MVDDDKEPEDLYLFKLRIQQQLFDRLALLGARLGYPSANKFAVDALDLYAETIADLMDKLRKQQRSLIERQREQLLSEAHDHESGRRK